MKFRAYLFGLYAFFFTPSCKFLKPLMEKTCASPPIQYQEGYLNQCFYSETQACCAYAYLQSDEKTVCFHVLCQAKDKCEKEFEFVGSACPNETSGTDGDQSL